MNGRTRKPPAKPREKGRRIPLDLAPSLPDIGRYDRLLIRIEGVPYGASISAGRSNGDRNWSVPADNISGLCYIPAVPDFEAHVLCVRVIGADDEEAVVLYQYDLRIEPGNATPVVSKFNRSGGHKPEPQAQFTGRAEPGSAALEAQNADLKARLELAEAQIMEIRGIATAAAARLAAVEAQVKDDPNHATGTPGGGSRRAIRAVSAQA